MNETFNQKNLLYRTTSQRRWTPTAIECHKRGCSCQGCFYDDFFQDTTFKCKMKGAVLELVRTVGLPPVRIAEALNEGN